MSRPVSIYTSNIASGGDSAVFNLDHGWTKVYLDIGSMSTTAALTVYGGQDASNLRILHNIINTATVSFVTFIIQAVYANSIVELPSGFQHMKVVGAATVANGVSMSVLVS